MGSALRRRSQSGSPPARRFSAAVFAQRRSQRRQSLEEQEECARDVPAIVGSHLHSARATRELPRKGIRGVCVGRCGGKVVNRLRLPLAVSRTAKGSEAYG